MKYDEKLVYNANIRWDKATGGIIDFGNCENLRIDTPIEFEGRGLAPCPDKLFLASIGGCLLNTFTNLARKLDLPFLDAIVSVKASLSLHRDGYIFDYINAELRICCSKEHYELAERCGVLARNYCHITRSIEPALPVNVNIEVDSKTLCINP